MGSHHLNGGGGRNYNKKPFPHPLRSTPLYPSRSAPLCLSPHPLRSTPLCPSPYLGTCFYSAMENCLDLAIRTGGAAGSDAPTQTLIRLFRRTGRPADTLVYKSHTRVCVYILRKGCPPVRLVYPLPSIFFEFWRKDRHKKTSLKFRDSFGNDGTISVLKRYSQMILL